MAADKEDDNYVPFKELKEAIESKTIEIHTISFYFNQSTFAWHQPVPGSITISSTQPSFSPSTLPILSISIHSIRHLSFHFLTWLPHHLQHLSSLLQTPHTFSSFFFHRNIFHPHSLSHLSQSMKSLSVREIVFSESSIGSFGAQLFASALTFNKNVQNLQILNDSIGEEGAEGLSKMLEANSTLKTFTILDSIHTSGAPMVSAALGRSRSIEIHVLSRRNGDDACKMMDLVAESGILRVYQCSLVDSCRIVCSMGTNTTITTMDLTGVRLGSRFAKEFMYVIEVNQVLREVRLSKTCLKDKAVVYIAIGLFKNKKLERLYMDGNWFGGVGVEHLVCPLSRFSAIQIQANTSLRCLVFGGGKMKLGRRGVAALVRMLETNQSLRHLGIHGDKGLGPDQVVRVLGSLEGNTSVKSLSLRGCRGAKGEAVMEAVMGVLEKNPWMEEIDLGETPLEEDGMTKEVYRKLAHKNKETDDDDDGAGADDDTACVDLFKDMSLTAPKSYRVFLCGEEFAGKAILYTCITQYFSTSKISYFDQVKTLVGTDINITTIKHEETTFSLWNLCGKHYLSYNIYDLMFPGHGGTSFFLIVSSFLRNTTTQEPKSPEELREDLHSWISFIVSCSKATHRDQTAPPNITIVLTDLDRGATGHPSPAVVAAVQSIRDVFQSSVNFFPTVFMVDVRSPSSVSRLVHHILKTGSVVLELSPLVYDVCNELVKLLSGWRAENDGRPVMRWAEFCELCQVKVPSLRMHRRHGGGEMVDKRRRAVACSLHDMGQVLHFPELGFLILDFMWLCNDVIVCLRKLGGRKSGEKNFMRRNELAKDLTRLGVAGSGALAAVEGGDLVGMMMKMGICYQLDVSHHDPFLLVPSLLPESGLKPQWNTMAATDYIYVGRRLEVDASSYNVFFPGFFSRLQVYLHEKLVHGVTVGMEKYLVELSMNGMHIRLELGGDPPKYIDLLVRSTKNLTDTLRFLKQFAISAVHSVSGGASFIEKVIRPECIKALTPLRHRRTQCLSLHQLKAVLLSLPADSMYEYQHTWDAVFESGLSILHPGFDLARELLSDDDFREVLNSRYTDLSNLAAELQVREEEQVSGNVSVGGGIQYGMVDPSFSGIAKGVEVVIQRLRIIEHEIRDMKQEIRGLRYYENRLLLELGRKMDFLSTYNISAEERKMPTLFYFTRSGYTTRRLVANIVSGMTALRLHMLCEFRAEMHSVEGQLGCEVLQIDNRAVRSLAPYTQKFMTLMSYALKIGAHLVAGMGGMIPDLGREMGRLLDTPMVSGATPGAVTGGVLGVAAVGALGGVAVGRAVGGRGGGDIGRDMGAAQQWVADFLREKGCSSGKDMAEIFGLWRVRYRNSGQVAWICRRHMELRGNEVVPFPF